MDFVTEDPEAPVDERTGVVPWCSCCGRLSSKKSNVERHYKSFSHLHAQWAVAGQDLSSDNPRSVKAENSLSSEQQLQRIKIAYHAAKNPTSSFNLAAKSFNAGRKIFSDPLLDKLMRVRKSVDEYVSNYSKIMGELRRFQEKNTNLPELVHAHASSTRTHTHTHTRNHTHTHAHKCLLCLYPGRNHGSAPRTEIR